MTCSQENDKNSYNNNGWTQVKMFTCPFCHGVGFWYTHNITENKKEKIICNVCDGDGIITVYQDLPGFED